MNPDGTIVIAGQAGYGFPITAGAYTWSGSTPVGGGFVSVLSADLSDLVASAVVTPSSDPLALARAMAASILAGAPTIPAYLSYYPGSTSGSSRTYFNDVAVGDGVVVVVGQTYMNDLPATGGAFDRTCNGGTSDAFVAQFDKTGSGSRGGGGSPPADIAPVADAGNNQTVRQRQTVYLDGSGTSDPDGQIVRYRWTQLSGKRVSIRNADTARAYFTAPRVRRGTTRTLEFELEVTDDLGATAVDQVTISVTP